MRVMRIREEVIGLRRPITTSFVQRIQIARRCRIEHIHVAAIHLLDKMKNDEQIWCEEDAGWKN